MTDRERLIEILRKPIFPHELVDPIEAVADYLLDNGVVVRDKGEWVGDSKEECPFCGERSKWFYENFCPNCGADMRGEHGN